jgi:4-amino-4-deoxy-L-arabinose transferase-like glycosyltransferase
VQAIIGAAICWFAYRLALALTGDERAGLFVAGALAVSPVFVIEPAQILTETLYMFLVTAGLTLYVEWRPTMRRARCGCWRRAARCSVWPR